MISERQRKNGKIKTVVIIILAVIVALEGAGIALLGAKTMLPATTAPTELPDTTITIETTGLGKEVSAAITQTVDGLKEGALPAGAISGVVKSVVYSDAIVSTIASLVYPLLYSTLTNLGMMDFAENVKLYPTGPQFAKILDGKGYTAVDKDGTRKALTDILNSVGENWDYMNTKVTVDGTEMTIWESTNWGVTDKESFYTAMNNMSEGFRGVIEVTLQYKTVVCNINPVEYLTGKDSINVNMDAAKLYSAASASGYSLCLIPLFTTLGLVPGEYETNDTFCSHEVLGDLWKGILEPIFTAVDKIAADPLTRLPDLLVNFAYAIESGTLVKNMREMRMDGDFNSLVTALMGFEDRMMFNLGDTLIDTIGGMGINIGGSFNDLLDSLPTLIGGSKGMPDMSVQKLLEGATTETVAGYTVYHADRDNVIACLVEYIIHEDTIAAVLNTTPIAGTQEATDIINAVKSGKNDLNTVISSVISIILSYANKK